MVTTDKVTVVEFTPHIVKTTTDYKENEMKMPWEQVITTESRFNQIVQKDQPTLIADLINRVTSLEETVELILEHSPITEQTKVCDECIYVEGSQWCEKCDGEPKHWAKGE